MQDIQTLTLWVKEHVWTTGESSRELGCRTVMEVQENAPCCIVHARATYTSRSLWNDRFLIEGLWAGTEGFPYLQTRHGDNPCQACRVVRGTTESDL